MTPMASHYNHANQSSAEYIKVRTELLQKLDKTNINSSTFLTTDYINHFSAIFMMLEMLPTQPETFVTDILFWEPLNYIEYLEQSNFPHTKLAKECYNYTDENVRKAFDTCVDNLQRTLRLVIDNIRNCLETGQSNKIAKISEIGKPHLEAYISDIASIINGNQSTITHWYERHLQGETAITLSQADIASILT